MKKINGFLQIVGIVVKYAGIATVIIKTIEFFHAELSKLDLDKDNQTARVSQKIEDND